MPSLSEVFQSMVDAVRLAPSNYSAVFTGTCLGMRAGGGMDSLVDAQKRLNFTVTRPVVVASGLSRCTHGYVLSAWGALRMATSLPLDGPIDHSFNHGGPKSGRRGDAVSIYHMEPAVLIQKGDLPHSDIRVDERRRRRRLAEHAAAVDWR
ncbi:hypothetical protein M427DRAFT_58851 [Gonapodya prolifera JEL478]|uniref:Uncharacterized protein n=1 Tax=Gonapodya prolifera (strain JEL478) TaxID=1344416 RepID=A0A139A9H8_GONPJ|nr:hypothetical protein M427DRAFT_58851 [Gonapodya prolifera JEL478]|eukprot:KXS13334.1 hypothetical protein M427DRAFT_58851 [Gonapodya prolifera JEL478]